MRKAYREAMNRIAVTEEMQMRILAHIGSMEIRAAKRKPFPIRYFAAAACFALLIAGATVLPSFRTSLEEKDPPGVQTGIPNRTEVSSIEELSQAVGFEVELLGNLPFEVTDTQYIAYGQALAEVNYRGETQDLMFRKTVGNTDPSGDYTAYSDTSVLELGNRSVILKGESGRYSLAVWQDGTYSYSIRLSAPYSDAEWMAILETLA